MERKTLSIIIKISLPSDENTRGSNSIIQIIFIECFLASKQTIKPGSYSIGAGNLIVKIQTNQTISNEVYIICKDNYMMLQEQLTKSVGARKTFLEKLIFKRSLKIESFLLKRQEREGNFKKRKQW